MTRRSLVAAALALIAGFVGGYVLARWLESEADPAEGQVCDVVEPGAPAPLPAGDELITRLAPLVFLHPNEGLLPMPAGCFLEHARLGWAGGEPEIEERGEVDARMLGTGAYRNDGAKSNDYTRPFDAGHERSGFYLDLANELREGARSTAEGPVFTGTPAYYERGEGYLTYWFFYGYSAAGALAVPGGATGQGHEGDWEQVAVELDGEDPVALRYFAHGAPRRVTWEHVPRFGTHPVVFSAQGSHASYPTAGRQGDLDQTRAGFLWPTWDYLLDVKVRDWYGYGGAWGDVGARADRTGPLGPSPYKRSL